MRVWGVGWCVRVWVGWCESVRVWGLGGVQV